jgi:LysR family hydrogen peroxide-inducible transcriptional activator
VVKPFARPVPTRSVGAVWRKSSARTAAIDAVSVVIHASTDARAHA